MADTGTVIHLPYRKGFVSTKIPKSVRVVVAEPNEVSQNSDELELISNSIDNPCGGYTLDDFFQQDADSGRKGKLLVIINDQTRPTPTKTVLDVLADRLDIENTVFIIATGVHRSPTEEEYKVIFGTEHYNRFADKIAVHNARNDDEMIYLGKSSTGTEILINKLAVESDRILVIGSVEPHYFAGYTGGRKGLLPGIASYRTIEQNHKHALDNKAQSLSLVGNPVHEDMLDALKFINKPIFAIMTVLNKDHGVYAATAGDIRESFDAAQKYADDVFVVDLEDKADIVISVARHPMDIDLYQSQKAIDNGKLAMKDGGILILLSSCRDGIGEKAYVDLLSSCATPEKVLEKIQDNYKLGWHKAGKMAKVSIAGEIWGVTELPDDLMRSVFIKPCSDLQRTVDEAIKIKGDTASIVILPDGCVTVPRILKY
ncbi:MAG: nickel-dependent lactate racemase [Spirochaetaceae bacterium]|nr:nickel-dependent lactate racemase [Spirochaetaceae bacterium]